MTMEHWTSSITDSVFPKDAKLGDGITSHVEFLLAEEPDARKCCEISGNDFDDCMEQYHEHMGWEPYVPMSDA